MKDLATRRVSVRSASLVSATVVPLMCSGCFTAQVWGHVPEPVRLAVDERNAARGTGAVAGSEPSSEPETYGFFAENWTVWSVGLRALLTPFAVWVDLTTWPEQIMSSTLGAHRHAAKNES